MLLRGLSFRPKQSQLIVFRLLRCARNDKYVFYVVYRFLVREICW